MRWVNTECLVCKQKTLHEVIGNTRKCLDCRNKEVEYVDNTPTAAILRKPKKKETR